MVWLVAGGVVGVLAGLIVLWRRPWRGPRTRYPVVLAHGLFGFGEVGSGLLKQEYFHGILSHLRELGLEVSSPSVPPVASIATRAQALADHVRALPAGKVNIIAHSMGGLDARYAISRLGLADRVASLITIGTPHHGTPVADAGMSVLGAKVGLGPLLALVGLKAFLDLTEQYAGSFNAEVANVPGVYYGAVLATVSGDEAGLNPLLRPTYRFLQERGLPNDGMVPVASQKWGRVVRRVSADHWAQIGRGKGLDAKALYLGLLGHLRARRL